MLCGTDRSWQRLDKPAISLTRLTTGHAPTEHGAATMLGGLQVNVMSCCPGEQRGRGRVSAARRTPWTSGSGQLCGYVCSGAGLLGAAAGESAGVCGWTLLTDRLVPGIEEDRLMRPPRRLRCRLDIGLLLLLGTHVCVTW